MHIAICDDNVADRKQTERLMGREADKWINAGDPLYIYSYGSAGSLLANSMEYDGILLDVRSDEMATSDVMKKLHENGVDACIIVSDELDEKLADSESVMYLKKPINPAELHELLSRVKEIRLACDTSRIELRAEHETLYVEADEIVYGELDGYGTTVTLTGGRKVKINTLPQVFFDEIESKHAEFALPSYSFLLNIKHISGFKLSKAIMDDGKVFKVRGAIAKYIKYVHESFDKD